jgi:hypothetical protein
MQKTHSQSKEKQNMTFKPAMTVKKEYAEKAFDIWGLKRAGSQFTIVEDLKVTASPRAGKKTLPGREGKTGVVLEVALIKVSDGIFEKDMQLTEYEWQKLNEVRPDGLISLKGSTFGFEGDKLIFVGVALQDIQGNQLGTEKDREIAKQNSTNAPGQTNDTLALRIKGLKEAMALTASLGTKVDSAVLIKIAERFEPGNALGLISSAKNSGDIMEKDNIYYVV